MTKKEREAEANTIARKAIQKTGQQVVNSTKPQQIMSPKSGAQKLDSFI